MTSVNDMITDEKGMKESTLYFGGEELPASVFINKYALRDSEMKLKEATPSDMHRRLAKEFSRIENSKFNKPYSEEEIFSFLDKFERVVPQGSPMYGIGNPYQIISLSNCYVVPPPKDSYGGICLADQQLVQISKRRGGVGTDISELRPEGSPTKNAAKTSTGIIPFLERFSNSIREVGQAGRRGALMVTISVHHPEVLSFAKVKNDLTKVTGANISVRLTDEFLQAVEKNETYELRWPVDAREKGKEPEVSMQVEAVQVWKEIVKNAHAMAEPGLLFWDNIIKQTPADCYAAFGFKTVSTNPCSEIPLCPYDSCRLMVINLLSCVDNPFTSKAKFNFDRLKESVYFTQRMMDNLIDLELECIDKIIDKIDKDPEIDQIKRVERELWQSIKDVCENGRRTGTGITALGDVMAALGIKYSSSKSIDLAEEIYKTIKLSAYRCSVDMAKEVGPFSCYNSKLEEKCPFIQRIAKEDPDLYKDMVKYGRRNIALLTIAPTGSVSILTQTTSGVEPLFQVMYIRRRKVNPNDTASRVDFVDKNGDKWQEYPVYHPQVKKWFDINFNEFDNWLKKQVENEIEHTKIILSVVKNGGGYVFENKYIQKFVEENNPWKGSCANDLDWKKRVELQARIQQHCDHAISSTLNLPNEATEEQVAEIYETAWKAGCKGITVYRDGCRDGVLITKKETPILDSNDFHGNGIVKTHASKRPESLPAELFHTSVKKMRYYVAVGFKKDDPFEVFTGMNHDNDGEIVIPKNVSKGKIVKKSRGKYVFIDQETGVEYNLTNGHSDENADALTRSISWGLRHGGGIEHAVNVLEKTKGDLTSFSKSIARALKRLIPDGTAVSGEECKNCGSHNLTRQEGCISCKDCGWTKCS